MSVGGFSRDDARRIGAAVKNYERRPRNLTQFRGRYPVGISLPSYAVIKTSGSVTAKSGTTLGLGAGRFYEVVAGAYSLVAGQTVDTSFYNPFTRGVNANAYVPVAPWGNGWIMVNADCADVS
jgi:hypothetical protein